MKVLVACEYSGRVREAFRKRGHDAWSCDLLPSEDNSPFHIQQDIRDILSDKWDMLIAHPPCTHLAVSGARWFKNKKEEQREAIHFFKLLANFPIERVAVENPISIMSTHYRKPDQIIQPWMFGESYSKATCLWLKNLPQLIPTKIVDRGEIIIHGGKRIPKWYSNREVKRDLTFQGIADAMAEQWGYL